MSNLRINYATSHNNTYFLSFYFYNLDRQLTLKWVIYIYFFDTKSGLYFDAISQWISYSYPRPPKKGITKTSKILWKDPLYQIITFVVTFP